MSGDLRVGLFPGISSLARTQGGEYRSVQVFTSTGTWTKPPGLKRVKVTVIGGGGSGGGQLGGTNRGPGGGGGGGSIKTIAAASLGVTETVTVGAGGASVNTNVAGNAGGTSSFGANCSATGGAGGAAAAAGSQSPATGGTGSGGDINIQGQHSETKAGYTGVETNFPGRGGASALGFGSPGENVGGPGKLYGGGGASENHTGGGSGAGAAGIVIVEEFF